MEDSVPRPFSFSESFFKFVWDLMLLVSMIPTMCQDFLQGYVMNFLRQYLPDYLVEYTSLIVTDLVDRVNIVTQDSKEEHRGRYFADPGWNHDPHESLRNLENSAQYRDFSSRSLIILVNLKTYYFEFKGFILWPLYLCTSDHPFTIAVRQAIVLVFLEFFMIF